MKKLLLHVCCGPCSTHVIDELKDNEMTLFFYNPNIYPRDEYLRRLEAASKVADKKNIHFIDGDYDQETWDDYVKGYEKEPEGGKRCELCFEYRLRKTAEYARKNGFDTFATTLTISPHKDAKKIHAIGKAQEKEHGVSFLESDFKKGFKESVEMSKELGLYRQNYCGCRFSMRR